MDCYSDAERAQQQGGHLSSRSRFAVLSAAAAGQQQQSPSNKARRTVTCR